MVIGIVLVIKRRAAEAVEAKKDGQNHQYEPPHNTELVCDTVGNCRKMLDRHMLCFKSSLFTYA